MEAEKKKRLLSFVIPCYRSALTLPHVVEEIVQTMYASKYQYEIIMVNDSSPDGTWKAIEDLCKKHSQCKGLDLAKNFGQHAALLAGYAHASGDMVVSGDDDGQTPFNQVMELVSVVENGVDVAMASYPVKKHSFLRNIGSKINNLMSYYMLGKPLNLRFTSYFVAKKFVIESILDYKNPYPYMRGLVLRATKNIVNVSVEHRKREEGKSGYSFKKLLGLWINGFTAFSVKPLRIASFLGGVMAVLGFLLGLYIVIKKILMPEIPIGWSSLMAMMSCSSGLILLVLGMIGEYVGRIYISINNQPQYLIRQKII